VGFVAGRQRGSHIILVKDDRVVPVPRHHQIKRGLLLEIIAEAGMTREEFLKLL
jgi:predicted RNA binding protein YcfA (HicA-like mRNA interferase family)